MRTLPCHANIIQRKVKIFSKAAARPLRFSEARIIPIFPAFPAHFCDHVTTLHFRRKIVRTKPKCIFFPLMAESLFTRRYFFPISVILYLRTSFLVRTRIVQVILQFWCAPIFFPVNNARTNQNYQNSSGILSVPTSPFFSQVNSSPLLYLIPVQRAAPHCRISYNRRTPSGDASH